MTLGQVIIVLIVALAVFGLYRKGSFSGLLGGVRMPMPGTATKEFFSSGDFALILAFLFLEFTLWQYVPAVASMFTGLGLLHLIIYPIGILIFSLVEAKLEGKRYGLALIMLIVGFSAIGLYHFSFGGLRGSPDKRQVATPMPQAPQTGVTLTAILGPIPIELNPGGSYHIRWDEVDINQCVKIFDPSNRLIGNDCNGDLDLKDVRAAKFASARGDLVRINYVLTPRWN